jgi:hypothetical protein
MRTARRQLFRNAGWIDVRWFEPVVPSRRFASTHRVFQQQPAFLADANRAVNGRGIEMREKLLAQSGLDSLVRWVASEVVPFAEIIAKIEKLLVSPVAINVLEVSFADHQALSPGGLRFGVFLLCSA